MMGNNVRGIGAWSMGEDDGSSHLSDLALDQLLTGEVEGTPVAEARRAHLAQCPACAARRREIEEDGRRLLAARPTLADAAAPAAGAAAASPAPRPDRGRGLTALPRRRRLAAFGGVAAAAAAAVVIAVGLAGPGTRPKGPPLGLELFVRHADGRVEALLPEGAALPGDAVRVAVTARRAGYVGLASVDARGAVTSYMAGEARLVPVAAAGERRVLEGSTVLDDTLGPERLLGVLCPERLEVRRLLEAVEAHAAALDPAAAGSDRGPPPDLGLGCQQTSFRFLKVAAR